MKVKVLKKFNDLKEGVTREIGDTFECSKTRYNEIKKTLSTHCPECTWIEEIKEEVTKDGTSTKNIKS